MATESGFHPSHVHEMATITDIQTPAMAGRQPGNGNTAPEYRQLNAGNQALDGDPDPPIRRGNIEERMVVPL